MAKLSLKNIWNKQTIFLLCVLLFALIYCCFRMSNASYFGKPLLEGANGADTGGAASGDAASGDAASGDAASGDAASGDAATTELTANDLDEKLSAIQGDTTPTGVYLGNYQLRKTNNANLGQIQGSNQSNHRIMNDF